MNLSIIPGMEVKSGLEIGIALICGSIGAIVKDIIQDNSLELPCIKEGKVMLGFVGGALIGGFVGAVVDGSVVSATLAGYTGASVIVKLLNKVDTDDRSVDQGVKKVS